MSDLISRQDAIDVIMGEPTDAHYPSWYADKIKALPSAGQNCVLCEYYTEIETDDGIKGKCTRRTGSDLISRQGAINCCSCLHPEDCWDEIRKLPSADEQDNNRLYIKIYADDEPSRKAEKLYQICGETENQEVAQWIKEYFPSTDRPTGKWIKSNILPNGWHCSHCDSPVMTDDIKEMLYCPNCGAKMVREERKDD